MTNDNENNQPPEEPSFVLPAKVYNFVKWLVLIVVPAFSTLYFTLGNQFGWTNVEAVIGTCAAVATFLGGILGISNHQFNKVKYWGDVVISEGPDGTIIDHMAFNDVPTGDISKRDEVVLKVINTSR